jgi:Right handed beta helix region
MSVFNFRCMDTWPIGTYLIGLTLLFGFATQTLAATYYVCDHAVACNAGSGSGWRTGSDSFSKSQAQSKTTPWKTIDKAEENVSGGDTVIVGDGVYNTGSDEWDSVVVWVTANGAGKTITFRSENKWGARIDGKGSMYGGIWIDESAGYIRFEDFEIANFNILGVNSKDKDDQAPYRRSTHIAFYRLKVHEVGRVGIYMQETDNGHIDSCLIYNLTSIASNKHNQYHGIYISDNTDNITVRNNLVYGTPEGWPIHVYDGHGRGRATNHTILNNTLINDNPYRDGGLVLYGHGHTVRNNLMYDATDASGYRAAIYNTTLDTGTTIEYNMTNLRKLCERFSANGSCGLARVSANRLDVDFSSMFTNPAARDYALNSGAPAIDAGFAIGTLNTDYSGAPRPQGARFDIGAFEFAPSDQSSMRKLPHHSRVIK